MPSRDAITPIRHRFYLTATAIGVILLIIGAFWVIGQIWTPISIVLFSAFLVFVLRVPVAFLERKGVPRGLGAAIMYVVALLVIAAIALVFIPVVVEQLIAFIQQLPQYMQTAASFWSQTFEQIDVLLADPTIQALATAVNTELTKWATSLASDSASAMFTTASTIGNLLLVTGVSIIVGFWVLKDLPKFGRELRKVVGPKRSEDVRVISNALTRSLGGYLRGMVVSCLCTGTMAFIFYSILGMPYPLVLAFFTGLMVFIPFIGPTIAWILAGVVGFFLSPITGVLAAVLTIVSQMINDNLISPRVMSDNVELHPGIILIVIFIGASLGGVFGMLCAVPLTAAVKAIFVYYFEKRTGRQLVSEDGALFKGHPAGTTDPVADASDGNLAASASEEEQESEAEPR